MPQVDSTLKLVTLNLYHDKDEWPKRRTQIVDTLAALQPDVIALQEVLQHDTLPNQAQWLAQELGYHWYFISVDPEDKARRYGNALLTRHPVLARGQQRLQPMEDSRTAGFVRIKLQGQPVNVYVTHLHHTPEGKALRTQPPTNSARWPASVSAAKSACVPGWAIQSPEILIPAPARPDRAGCGRWRPRCNRDRRGPRKSGGAGPARYGLR